MNTPGRRQTLQDAVVAFIRERPEGVPSAEIAERFLKIRNPDRKTATLTIAALLGTDRRCCADAQGLWHAEARSAPESETLTSLPWTAVYCLTDPGARRILYCALWKILPVPSCISSGWLIDPLSLPCDESETLRSASDAVYGRESVRALLSAAAADEGIPVFISQTARALLESACAAQGEVLTDDTETAAGLLKAAGLPGARPFTLASLEIAVLGAEQSGASARKQGERFAAALLELIRALSRNGIESRAQLDFCASRDRASLFAGRNFTYETLLALPERPGVYGFKDRAGTPLYIGKANNLKRRLMSYFAETGESPQKISRLRAQAHGLVTHACGSELECLIYEYRLIKKHSPPLNRQKEIFERKGHWRPVGDCIVLLPHAEEDKGMSVWFRESQKILLKSFSTGFETDGALLEELKRFFFTPRLPAAVFDFPEQEIAVRWIKRHADALAIVPVSRLSCAEEIMDAMRIAWRDMPLRASGTTARRVFRAPGSGKNYFS
ncbi:MAG: nucleotide excision repair endonuclease [Chitinispirillaceae bacterium]|nr:nucleotide excision repair endonuclease [Chitinispirillaceae bacterium]